MFGHLIPCGGGRSIPLTKRRLVLGPKRSDAEPGERIPQAELSFDGSQWLVCRLPAGDPLRINDIECDGGVLLHDDVLSIGAHRYRIAYPGAIVPAVAPPQTPRPVLRSATAASVFGILVPCGGGPAVALRKPRVVIGRATGCDVVLAHKTVSSHHCGLKFSGHWQMRDLDSTNGTMVDGMLFRCKWIFPGSILGVGIHRFRIEYSPEGERPPTDADDQPVAPTRTLMASVGLTRDGLEQAPLGDEQPELVPRTRWKLEDE